MKKLSPTLWLGVLVRDYEQIARAGEAIDPDLPEDLPLPAKPASSSTKAGDGIDATASASSLLS